MDGIIVGLAGILGKTGKQFPGLRSRSPEIAIEILTILEIDWRIELAQFAAIRGIARDIPTAALLGCNVFPNRGRAEPFCASSVETTDTGRKEGPRHEGCHEGANRVETRELATGPMLAAAMVGSGLFRMPPGDVPARGGSRGPVPEGWSRMPPSLLRYSDEQTVAGTAAVFSAMEAMGVAPGRFEGWGVVAASRYLGRANLAAALRSFHAEGVWGISPHLIPHFALHSPSGTISLALGLHGPNLGVGGGLYAAAEGVLAALTWLAAGIVPGVWLVLTGWSPELIPNDRDAAAPPRRMPGPGPGLDRRRRRARAAGAPGRRGRGSAPGAAPVDLVSLAESLEMRGGPSPRTIATDPSGRLRVELVEGYENPG